MTAGLVLYVRNALHRCCKLLFVQTLHEGRNMASVTKEFHRLLKRVNRLTDRQVTIAEIDWDEGNLECFHIVVQPNDGLYKNGKFKFDVRVSSEYPEIPPVVWCNTDIYHPNIDSTEDWYGKESTNVCLNLLDNGVWNKSYGLEGVVLGLLFLMHNPNLTDPLSPYFEGGDDWSLFEENVRKYMAGEEFDDISFDTRDFRVVDGVLIEDAPEANNIVAPKSSEDVNDRKTDCASVTVCESNPRKFEACTSLENDATSTDDKLMSVLQATSDEVPSDLNIITNDVNPNNVNVNVLREDEVHHTEKTGALVSVNNSEVEEDSENVIEDEDENSHLDIELVNIDGGYYLKVHNSDFNKTEDQNADSNEKGQNVMEGSNSDTSEIDDSLLTNVNNENTYGDTEVDFEIDNKITKLNENIIDSESMTNLITCAAESPRKTPVEEDDHNDNDNDGYFSKFSTKSECHCHPWSRIKSAFCKIIHTVVQHKLYRDIGI